MGRKVAQGCRRFLGVAILGLLVGSFLPGQTTPGYLPTQIPSDGPVTQPDAPPPTEPDSVGMLPPPKDGATHSDMLAHYRRLALQNQPALAAYRASLCVAQTKVEAINKIGGIASLIRKDLEIRKEQVQHGVLAAQAQLSVAAWETLYGVTRNYWSCVYAQEVLEIANEALDPNNKTGLLWLRQLVKDTVEGVGGRRDLVEWHITSLDLVVEGLKAKKIEAEIGLERARAAMREAMGVPPDFPIHIPCKGQMPWLAVEVERCKVIEHAMKRRGEITQTMVFREVSALEVQAQQKGSHISFKGETFATGSDIHVQSVPMQVANGEYRPGGVGPEMPGVLPGKRDDRVLQAHHYAGRADAVVAKTKQLLTLQAEDAYWKYEKATREVEAYRKVVDLADKLKEKVPSEFANQLSEKVAQKRPKPSFDDVLVTILKGSQVQLNLFEARYQRLLALTLLERVTAGGINPGFDEPLPLRQPYASEQPERSKDEKPEETLPEPMELRQDRQPDVSQRSLPPPR